MQVTVFDNTPKIEPRMPNVETEQFESGGYSYSTLTQPPARLFLGFTGKLQQNSITYINPHWGVGVDVAEILPASKNNISINLSTAAKQLGAIFSLQFSGTSPRIVVTFDSLPKSAISVGVVTIGFIGIWPLKGAYTCSGLRDLLPSLRKAMEPYGTIVLRQTWLRILNALATDLIQKRIWMIKATDDLAVQFIKDNLLADLSDLLTENVGGRAVTLNPSSTLPDNITNIYENTQESIFVRDVDLVI